VRFAYHSLRSAAGNRNPPERRRSVSGSSLTSCGRPPKFLRLLSDKRPPGARGEEEPTLTGQRPSGKKGKRIHVESGGFGYHFSVIPGYGDPDHFFIRSF